MAPAVPRARDGGTAGTSRSAAGAPASLRSAVRFVVVGFSAMVLTAQVAGIRLTAPVDADPTYCVTESQRCKQGCRGEAGCIRDCNRKREDCRHEDRTE